MLHTESWTSSKWYVQIQDLGLRLNICTILRLNICIVLNPGEFRLALLCSIIPFSFLLHPKKLIQYLRKVSMERWGSLPGREQMWTPTLHGWLVQLCYWELWYPRCSWRPGFTSQLDFGGWDEGHVTLPVCLVTSQRGCKHWFQRLPCLLKIWKCIYLPETCINLLTTGEDKGMKRDLGGGEKK